ncbi:ATP-binding cassette domain-containing protein [Saccharopolyspora indica]|uniref:methionine ABC transporter ATP-binding protein n=1 Tax=Saccharopolyspora indica TaxID=1229659 RepID=UPI0022EAB40C|nr:ATP-binding cassette domain-containing protein [Saccharopolyspora indica]MDA3642989.1 ATP-binding cassette domain-containing protein [Saccharopolyspora indica]
MITLRGVTKRFTGPDGPLTAVDDVDLHVPRGSVQGIIGFSGAGKSTLIRLINLLERPDSGSVAVDGTDLTTVDDVELRRRRAKIGMIFQHFNLLANLTAAQNVELALRIAGVGKAARAARVAEALAVVDLSDKAGAYPAKLSGGQQQRVAIARALANEPSVLLCDEPTSAVDPRTTVSVLSYLKEVNERLGITIVLVTHEMNVVRAIADDVAVMDGGKVVEHLRLDGSPLRPETEIAQFLIDDRIRLRSLEETHVG